MLRFLRSLFTPDPRDLSPPQAVRLIDEGARVVDVREANEFAAGHLPGAIRVPLGTIRRHGPAALQRHGLDPQRQPLLLVCRSGARSRAAMALLSRVPGAQVFNLRGGLTAWLDHDLPLQQRKG
ncbi:MAG: rhodanese-like domain-containing protein [Rehaibacterium terrae]|uniref:rhodanese-like domain-containing protein n=1 Tax=Rehaibacterium terrae TaxID=1341696 RepID=UPI00391C1C56